MGFESRGQGLGSTFFFELPLYSAATAGVDPTSSITTTTPTAAALVRNNHLPMIAINRNDSQRNIPPAINETDPSQTSHHHRDDAADEGTIHRVPPIASKSRLSSFLEVISLGRFVCRSPQQLLKPFGDVDNMGPATTTTTTTTSTTTTI